MSKKQDSIPNKYQSGWLDGLDSRTAIAKEIRDRYKSLTDDLGGLSHLSYQQRSLAERSIWLEHFLASQERKLSEGGDFDVNRWIQAANSLQGLYSKLGLTRVARDVQTLDQYLSKKTQGTAS